MGLARLVVIDGPDLGHEFEIPLRGGGIGRGEGSIVQLSDLAVSRLHCTIELREGKLCLVDEGSRNKTLVNGEPITVHVLAQGDEISVGKTRLSFLPSDAGVSVMRGMPTHVTMEIGSGELLRAAITSGMASASPASIGADDRARRHLASVANFGNSMRDAGDREAIGRAACEAALAALEGNRAFLLVGDASGRMTPLAAAIAPGDPDGNQLSLPREVVDKVISESKAIAIRHDRGDRCALAAPIAGFPDGAVTGILFVDRRGERDWDQIDLMAIGCLAHVLAAALAGFDSRDVLARENRELEERLGGGREFIGTSDQAKRLMTFVGKVGPTDATILLTGESGSGKEMVARAIHRASRRSSGPFIAVNCAALTETLIESELFGHERGAFTGATDRKLGRFELADKGTLFLDEVGELPLNCQTKFLRVLEEQLFERVGGEKSIVVDVRVIAATNRDLPDMVRRGPFREDLYYRLSVIHTVVPPLRERTDDIPMLAEYFLQRLRHQVGRRVTGFTEEAMRAMCTHPWPGNVRELKNAVERAIVLGESELIRADDLPPDMSAGGGPRRPTAPFNILSAGGVSGQPMPALPPGPGPHPTPAPGSLPHMPPAVTAGAATAEPAKARSLRELEKDGIIAALRATGGNKAQAAQILEIDRSTLYKKIKDYKIET